jgi:hypothetical protein
MTYLKRIKVLLPALAGFVFMLPLASCAKAQDSNIALNKSVIFSAKPNYALCTDPGDNIQLTDGKYSTEGKQNEVEGTKNIWVQKGTVGWQFVKPVVITIDLESVQPISGVSFSTGAGTAGVTWPTSIYMAVSDDNKTWRAAGDLVLLSRVNGAPPAKGYAAFRYVTHDLHTKGRYISFAVMATPMVFADEIEVYKGNGAWLNQPAPGEAISNITDYANASLIRSAAQRRLYDDISAIKKEIDNSALSASLKSTFNARLNQDEIKTAQMPQLGRDFKTILPLNETHRDVLAVRGELLAAQGFAPLTIWKKHRYSWLPFLAKPDKQEAPRLHFSMLRNQFRSDDLLLTNATGASKKVTLRLENAPGNAQKNWLQVYSVAWTDTSDGTPVANALIPVEEKHHEYIVEIPAGMTRKVWFTVDSSKVPAGRYKSTFIISVILSKAKNPHASAPLSDRSLSGAEGNSRDSSVAALLQNDVFKIPVTLDISNLAMNKPRLSLTMWDYSNGKGTYGITPRNRQAAIAMMRSHFVDTPWANAAVFLPWPQAGDFDAQENLQKKIDFSALDQWIALWPGAKRYMVFANVPDNFAGAKMDTPQFHARVGAWAKVLSQHIKELGLQPQQLGILLVDEPYRESQDATISAWASAINAAAPELTLFSDPRWKRPDQTKAQDAITSMDILCPALPTYNNGGKAVQKYFQDLRGAGKELWFYQTNGPSWQLDPQLYYRYQAWHAFAANATGEGFWSFGDTGKAPASWNGYSNTGISYAPAFLDEDTVFDSVHWDAVREGVEDYEELAMLKDAIAASGNAAWKAQAQHTLDNAVQAITGIWNAAHYATSEGDPYLADTQLQKVREILDTTTHDN